MNKAWHSGTVEDVTGIGISIRGMVFAIGYSLDLPTTFAYVGMIDKTACEWLFMARLWRFGFQITKRGDLLTRILIKRHGKTVYGRTLRWGKWEAHDA